MSLFANFHLNRQRQTFESSTLRSSYMTISQIMTEGNETLLLPTPRKLHVAFRLAYLQLILIHAKGGQDQGHVHFKYEYLANGDR